jgi:hypothetical protein
MRKLLRHALSPDCDHPTTGLVIVTEIMLFGFSFHYFTEELSQLLVACAFAHGALDIEFEMAAETWPQFPFTGKSQLVATFAEVQVGHRADETDALLRIGKPEV